MSGERAFATIDRVQLRALLRCYWRLSSRGKLTQTIGRRRPDKPRSLLLLVVMYTFMGLMTGTIAFAKVDVFTFGIVVHGMTFMIVGMGISAEAGDVLFNANENDVLVHRPIHPSTLLLAKALNLLAFAMILALALNLFPTVFGLAAVGARPWYPAVHLFTVALLGAFSAASVVCVYGLIVRFLDREKFDNFAAWSQVGMSILFAVGFQIVPRLMEKFQGVSLESYVAYFVPVPPAWFAAMDAAAAGSTASPSVLALAAIGLAATAFLAWIAIGKLAPSYGEGLAKLAESRARKAEPRRVSAGAGRARSPFLRWWLRDPIERTAFRLAAAYMRRDREVKLKLYPSLASFLILPIIAIVNPSKGFSTMVPLFTIGMLGTLPLTVMSTLRMSSQHAAADVFLAAPLESAAPVFHGVRKAVLWYLLVPAVVVCVLMIVFVVPGGRGTLLLGLPGLFALPTMSLLPGVFGSYLPLSEPPARTEQASKRMLLIWGSLIGMGLVVALSYMAWSLGIFWYLVVVEAIGMAVLYRVWAALIRNRPLTA
jgi:ABC-2 type transport system permease protein